MASKTDSGLSGLLLALVLGIFLATGLIAWASSGTTNSTVNPVISVQSSSTPCGRVADSIITLHATLQDYEQGTASIEQVQAATRNLETVTARETAALSTNIRRSLGPVRAELDKTLEIMSQPGATNREIADQSQNVYAAASAIPTLCSG